MARKFLITVDNQEYEVLVEEVIDGEIKTEQTPLSTPAPKQNISKPVEVAEAPKENPAAQVVTGGEKILAPLPGVVLNVLVKPGDSVSSGQKLLILEAMKMENEISSPKDGVISAVLVSSGQNVNTNDILVVVE